MSDERTVLDELWKDLLEAIEDESLVEVISIARALDAVRDAGYVSKAYGIYT